MVKWYDLEPFLDTYVHSSCITFACLHCVQYWYPNRTSKLHGFVHEPIKPTKPDASFEKAAAPTLRQAARSTPGLALVL